MGLYNEHGGDPNNAELPAIPKEKASTEIIGASRRKESILATVERRKVNALDTKRRFDDIKVGDEFTGLKRERLVVTKKVEKLKTIHLENLDTGKKVSFGVGSEIFKKTTVE